MYCVIVYFGCLCLCIIGPKKGKHTDRHLLRQAIRPKREREDQRDRERRESERERARKGCGIDYIKKKLRESERE